MKTIKALISFAYVDENGITTYTSGQVYEVSNEIATQMIAVGYAEEYSSGGGGSSDFSTAEVTIQITTANPDVYIAIPAIVTSPKDMILNQQYNSMNSSTAQILTVPLYKEALALSGQSAGEISVNVSGSVQQLGGGLDFLITGDCTITIS